MAGGSGDRTEKPTARRLKDAREKGQVARSRDLAAALSLAGATLVLGWFGTRMATSIAARLSDGLSKLADVSQTSVHPEQLASLFWSDAGLLAAIAGPPAILAAVVSVVSSTAQVGWAYSPKAIQLNWERLNPSAGFKRLLPSQAGIELGKALIGLVAIGGVCYLVVRPAFDSAMGLVGMPPAAAAGTGWQLAIALLWRASLALAIVAGLDYAAQRWRWFTSVKMTRQEVRDDTRMSDGSPETKARVRRAQREIAKRRMLQSVKTATVVVTNPTHFAVALQYSRHTMAAPVVVAKGQDLLAGRIRALAREHGVPIVENPPLARALHKHADVGDSIPADLFGAVAEVLAYLVRIKQLSL
jgi:flagellar biosynthetic protein FlhB